MHALLLALALQASDAPLAASDRADLTRIYRDYGRAPEPRGGALMGWGYSLASVGSSMALVSAGLYVMLASGSAACARARGCIDESGLAYMFAAIPLMVGAVFWSVGLPLLIKGHQERADSETLAD